MHPLNIKFGQAMVLLFSSHGVSLCIFASRKVNYSSPHSPRVLMYIGSYSHLAALRTIRAIQAPALCYIVLVLAYRRPQDRDKHLRI